MRGKPSLQPLLNAHNDLIKLIKLQIETDMMKCIEDWKRIKTESVREHIAMIVKSHLKLFELDREYDVEVKADPDDKTKLLIEIKPKTLRVKCEIQSDL